MKFNTVNMYDELVNLAADIFETYGVTLRLEWDDYDNYIVLDRIEKRPSIKSSPVAGFEAMREVIKFADKNEVGIKLIASASYGTPLDKLLPFYKHFGFKIGAKHPSDDVNMIRPPQ
jgi:hypothetical protein